MSVFTQQQVYALGSLLKISYFQIVPLLSKDMIFQHRRRLLILAGGAETRNEKQLHTNFSKLSVKNAVWFFD